MKIIVYYITADAEELVAAMEKAAEEESLKKNEAGRDDYHKAMTGEDS